MFSFKHLWTLVCVTRQQRAARSRKPVTLRVTSSKFHKRWHGVKNQHHGWINYTGLALEPHLAIFLVWDYGPQHKIRNRDEPRDRRLRALFRAVLFRRGTGCS